MTWQPPPSDGTSEPAPGGEPPRPGDEGRPPSEPAHGTPMPAGPQPTEPQPAEPVRPPEPPSAPSPWATPTTPAGGGPATPPPPAMPPPPPAMPPPPTTPPLPPAGAEYGQPYQAYAPARKTNTTAIVALILSLAGFVVGITAPIGAIMGHVARRQIRQTGEDGDGMAVAAVIIGWIITALIVLACVGGIIAIIVAATNGNDVTTY